METLIRRFLNLINKLRETSGRIDKENILKEYQDDDVHYIVDSQRDGNTLHIDITLVENTDKEEFEKWLKQVDDDLFYDVLKELGDSYNLDKMYNSENYKEVIDLVTSKTKELAKKRIKELESIIGQ